MENAWTARVPQDFCTAVSPVSPVSVLCCSVGSRTRAGASPTLCSGCTSSTGDGEMRAGGDMREMREMVEMRVAGDMRATGR